MLRTAMEMTKRRPAKMAVKTVQKRSVLFLELSE